MGVKFSMTWRRSWFDRPRPQLAVRRWGLMVLTLSLLLGAALLQGCHRGPKMVPVQGVVKYRGEPLTLGTVTFQPEQGQPARGNIQPDGTFVLSTLKPGDGAVVGIHKVRITCYSGQKGGERSGPGEQTLGKLLIPQRYTFFDGSGLTAEVASGGNEPFVFELVD